MLGFACFGLKVFFGASQKPIPFTVLLNSVFILIPEIVLDPKTHTVIGTVLQMNVYSILLKEMEQIRTLYPTGKLSWRIKNY